MRTLALLAALLLLALQAQAEPLPKKDDEYPYPEPPEGLEQVIAVSFAGQDRSALHKAGLESHSICHCRRRTCDFPETDSGFCIQGPFRYVFCCL